MAITYNLVEMLGGSIDVKSKPGEGTTFTAEHKTWHSDTVLALVVDDEEYACTHASLFIKDEHFFVVCNVWI